MTSYFFFFSNLFNTDKVVLIANLGKTSFFKGTARPNYAFLLKLPIILPKVLPRNPPDLMILDNCILLRLTSVCIFLAKACFVLVFRLIVRNNS